MLSPRRCAFGLLAQRFASSFSSDKSVVVFDPTAAGEALVECARRRTNNETFRVRPILQSETAARLDFIAPHILQSFASIDEQRAAFGGAAQGLLNVNGTTLGRIGIYDPGVLRAMRACVRLSDGLLVSSEAERVQTESLLQVTPPSEVRFLADPTVPFAPGTPCGRGQCVVVWAPYRTAEQVAPFVLALYDLHAPVFVVAGTTPTTPFGRARWLNVAEAENVLGSARVVVDTGCNGTDALPALSSWGAAVVADRAIGGQEHFDGVACYDRNSVTSIFDAVASAAGYPPPTARRRSIADSHVPATVNDGPLVSVVIATLDRPVLLGYALESISRQTYRNVETVVVVDGGPRLDSIAERYPNVRFIYMPEKNPVMTSNTGFKATRGEFVTFLDDDDIYFPNHIADLAGALVRSNANVAHGDVLSAFLRGSDQEWLLYGFESAMSRAADLESLFVTNHIGIMSVMFRRSCIADEAPFEEAVPLFRDYALWLRLAREHDFVHVERITSCYTIRNKGATQQSVLWADGAVRSYEVLYENHPVPDRPLILQRRRATIEACLRNERGLPAAPAVEVQPVGWPLFS